MEQKITKTKHLSTEQRTTFYQSKYDYYKSFNRGVLIISTIAYLTFFITDCGIFGRFSYETLLSRLVAIIPLLFFLHLYKKNKSYKLMVTATYFLVHAIIWCTDWATYILPDREYAGEGMIIMHLMFVCVGFCAPYKYCIVGHCGMIADILIANIFIRYDNVVMMLLFNIPCIVAVCIMHYIMEKAYLDHYLVTIQLEKLVVNDQLTGAYNRNKLKNISDPVTEELIIARDVPITFLIVDLDFFKKVNDQYGHESGDIVLKHTVNVIRQSVRSSDYIIRWGGEEFIILLTGCDVEKATSIAETIRANVESSDNSICPITISIGIASYDGGNYHETIESADKALYVAKAEGRNRVIVYKNGM